jgi:hypothetical protein
VSHEPAEKVYVPAEPVQLRDRNGALKLLSGRESCPKLRASVESIGALAGLHLNELTGQFEALSLRKLVKRLSLSLDAEPGAPLLGRANPDVCDDCPAGHVADLKLFVKELYGQLGFIRGVFRNRRDSVLHTFLRDSYFVGIPPVMFFPVTVAAVSWQSIWEGR